jgi:hypothetical protein
VRSPPKVAAENAKDPQNVARINLIRPPASHYRLFSNQAPLVLAHTVASPSVYVTPAETPTPYLVQIPRYDESEIVLCHLPQMSLLCHHQEANSSDLPQHGRDYRLDYSQETSHEAKQVRLA